MSRYALQLPGWEERSLWGWEQQDLTYFALLWRNCNDDDRPDFSLDWFALKREIDSPQLLARMMELVTGCTKTEALEAVHATAGLDARTRLQVEAS
jgi:hypothetical protein